MNKIFAKDKKFIDSSGREIIFSGVNVVDKSDYKIGEQKFPFLNEDTIKKFNECGFNLIRLGFNWAKIEPDSGKYNDAYIESLGEIIDLCEKYGIYVFLDMHQDLFSSVTNGDGAPGWAVCTDSFTSSPTKFVWAEDYFWGKACHRSFDNFWENKKVNGKGLQDWYADCWVYLVQKLGSKDAVIGFDIFNEPFPGSDGGKVFKKIIFGTAKTILFSKKVNRPKMIIDAISKDRVERVLSHISYNVLNNATKGANDLIKNFDEKYYYKFMKKITAAIRNSGSDKLIFLENSYYSNLGIPYSTPPIEFYGKVDSQQVFAPHAYDFMVDTPEYKYASNDRVGGIFSEHKKSQSRLNMPVVVGEWGGFGSDGDESWLRHIEFLLKLFDENKWSNTYWQYMDSFFESPLMKVFIRPFPKAICGEIENYSYDYEQKIFTLCFNQDTDGKSIISTPFGIKRLTLDGEEIEYMQSGSSTEIYTQADKHILKIYF